MTSRRDTLPAPRAVESGHQRRGEAIAGYLFIAIPMGLFLVLNIGAILYAVYISVWKWNVRSGRSVRRPPELHQGLHDPIFIRPSRTPSTSPSSGCR